MPQEWFVRRGDKVRGPLTSEEVRQLVAKGTLRSSDMVRKSENPEWREAGTIKGLFVAKESKAPVPPPLPQPKAEVPTVPVDPPLHSSLSNRQAAITSHPSAAKAAETMQAGLTDILSTAKQAKDVAAAHARKTQFTQLTLPKAYLTLGKDVLGSERFRDEFGDLFQRITATDDEIAKIATTVKGRPQATDLKGKLQTGAAQLQAKGQTTKLGFQRDSLIRELGKIAFDTHGASAGSSDLVSPITAAIEEIAKLDGRIAAMSSGEKGPLWQRLSLAAVTTFFCFPIGLILVWLNPRLSRRAKVTWSCGFAVLAIGVMFVAESNKSIKSGVPADGSTLSDTKDLNLPSEITQKKWPELSIAKMPVQLAQSKSADSDCHAFFSPNGTFVAVVLTANQKQELRLWNSATGDEHSAKSPDCDYFSLPASFSPDESRMACLDGDFLRVWDLKKSPASLMQTLQLSKRNRGDEWDALLWGKDDTLIVSQRSEEANGVRACQRLRLKANNFSLDGPIRSWPVKYKGESVRHSSMAISPDGNTLAVAVTDGSSGHMVVQAAEYESEKEIKEIRLPLDNGLTVERFPTGALLAAIEPNHSYFSDKGSCVEFTPDGQFLLVATNMEKRRAIKAIPTKTWQQAVDLDLGDSSPTGQDSPYRYMPRCYSKDGNSIVGLAIRNAKTSRGEKTSRVALVHNLVSGKRTAEIDLGEDFGANRGGEDERFDQEKVAFSSDGKSLVVAVAKDMGWNQKNQRSEHLWSVGSWRLIDGTREFVISGQTTGNASAVTLAPNGECVVLGESVRTDDRSMLVLDVPRLAKLRANCDEGDRLWAEGKQADALKPYCTLLSDDMAGLVCPNLARVWSRCIDAFAVGREIDKGRMLVVHLQQIDMPIEPETPQGKKVVSDLLAEQAEARGKMMKEAKAAGENRLVEVRARNQKNHVLAVTLSKREFIDKLRATASRGQISDSVTNAIFEDFSFQDTFGDPDSNIEWVDRKRLYSYRCNDGAIQLTIMIIDSRAFLSGINQF